METEEKGELAACKDDAWIGARYFVTIYLDRSDSAFPLQRPQDVVGHLGGGYYFVHACVDSEDLSGHRARKRFMLIVKHVHDQRYKLIYGPEVYDPGRDVPPKAYAIGQQAVRIAEEQAKPTTTHPAAPAGEAGAGRQSTHNDTTALRSSTSGQSR